MTFAGLHVSGTQRPSENGSVISISDVFVVLLVCNQTAVVIITDQSIPDAFMVLSVCNQTAIDSHYNRPIDTRCIHGIVSLQPNSY